MSDVVEFPSKTVERPPLLVGPFETYKVVVDGRVIPSLTGYPDGEGRTALVVDGRFGATFPDELAHQAAWLIAEAMAVQAGYTHAGAGQPGRPFARQSVQLGSINGGG